MKCSGSPHLVTLIDCTKVDEDSYFDIYKKTRRREAKEQTHLNENCPMSIHIPDGEFVACLHSIGTVMFLDTWFPTQGDLESYP